MKMTNPYRALVPLFVSATFAASGQTEIAPVKLEAKTESLNHFGFSYRAAFNLSTSFKNVGTFPSLSNPGAAVSGVDHTYDYGYNRVDSSGNNHFGYNATTFWGYQDAGQYDSTGGGSIAMHSSSSVGGSTEEYNDDPEHGFELTYNRQIFHGDHWRFGFEGAFNYMNVSVRDSRAVGTIATRITDVYQLNGATPADAPYDGSFGGPGTLLEDAPARTQGTFSESVTGSRHFDADLFGFRLGPYVEIPIGDRVAISFSGGLALIWANSEYSFNEMATLPNSRPVSIVGSSTQNDLIAGGYLAGKLSVALSERWSVFAGGQWQTAGDYTHRARVAGAGSTVLDLSNSLFATAGVGFSF
jgi:hypothetical protein